MDIQTLFNAISAKAKADALADKPIITLGHLIDLLRQQEPSATLKVQWPDGLTDYCEVDSYRGYYSDLAINNPLSSVEWAVAEVLEDLECAVGEDFTGYKGGNFTMGPQTLVWVSEYGTCSGLGVTGVELVDGVVIITSAQID